MLKAPKLLCDEHNNRNLSLWQNPFQLEKES